MGHSTAPSDNSYDPGGNQVPVLEQYKDEHQLIYSPVLLYPGLNTSFISERRFQRYRIYPR